MWIILCFIIFLFPAIARIVSKHVRHNRLRRLFTASRNPNVKSEQAATPVRALVVLGSGGHTSEMLDELGHWPSKIRNPVQPFYLIASSDRCSEEMLRSRSTRGIKSPCPFQSSSESINVVYVPRAREVGQSYWTSIATTICATLCTAYHMIRIRPHVIIMNGPGTCVPVALLGYFICGSVNVYVESFACVQALSVSGRIVFRMADVFAVQWEKLARELSTQQRRSRPRVLFAAPPLWNERLVVAQPSGFEARSLRGDRYVLITVGTTKFDELIQLCDSEWFVSRMRSRDYSMDAIHMQYGGTGARPSSGYSQPQDERFAYESDANFARRVAHATLIISHAGAGTVRMALGARVPLILVPNPHLMNNHQEQLCEELSARGLCSIMPLKDFKNRINHVDFKSLQVQQRCETPLMETNQGKDYSIVHQALIDVLNQSARI